MSVKPTIVELILNAPAAGKAMLSAVSAAAQKTLLSLVKGDVGLGNVDNTSDANKPVSTATQTALDAKADLVGGVVPSAQIPAIAITEYLGSVANQAAMLALTGDRGDWCLRSDTGTTFVLSDDDSSLLASWVELNYPTAPVTSVNGETGAVTLSASDVGAAATSHSHAQSDITNLTTDLAAKAAAATTITAGTALSGGGDLSANRTIDLEDTAVTPGSYTAADITVDAQGRITAAANGSGGGGGSPGGSSGQVQYNDAGAFGGMDSVVYASGGPHLTVTAQAASYIPLVLKGAASQTGNLFECQNSASAKRGEITKDGQIIATFDTAVISAGLLVKGSNGTTYCTLGFGGIYGEGSWVGMDVIGSIGRVNIGAGQMHITHASGNRSRVLTYGNLELSPGNLGGGGTYVEINSGTAGTFRDLKLRDMTASGLICAGTYTVGTLPSAAANAYKFATVSDSSVTAFGTTVAGGGSSKVKVFSNGSNWTVCAA